MKVYGMDLLDISDSKTETKVINRANLQKEFDAIGLKRSVKVATTSNISLSQLRIIDGIQLLNNDRILVKDQADAKFNGIYSASPSFWQRVSDTDASEEIVSGMSCFVELGDINGSKEFILTTPNPIVLGETPLTFASIITAQSFDNNFIINNGIVSLTNALVNPNVDIKTQNYTIPNNTVSTTILANNNITITLPECSYVGNNRICIKRISNNGPVTILPQGISKIDGQNGIVLDAIYTSITLISDGSDWFII